MRILTRYVLTELGKVFFVSLTGLTALMAPPDKFSFPSGHTMTSFAAWSSFLITLPWLAPLVLPAAILIGLSRIYLGLHYPTDVLMGALLGSLVGYLMTAWLWAII
jgi:undecaprenyl-diphosphatase